MFINFINKKVTSYINFLLLAVTLLFAFSSQAYADVTDPGTGGGGGSGGTGTSGGGYYPYAVAVKISILNSAGNPVETQIIFNNKGSNACNGSCMFASQRLPKFKQSLPIKWTSSKPKNNKDSILPNSWSTGSSYVDLDNILQKNNFANLKTLIKKYFKTKIENVPDGWVIVEGMARIDKYYGTAFELINTNYSLYYRKYSGVLFGGRSDKYRSGGALYNAIYLEKDIKLPGITLKKRVDGNNYENRTKANFMAKNGGGGIGVYKVSDMIPNGTLKITKKDEESNSTIYESVTFRLYKNNNCSGSYTTFSFNGTSNRSLAAGNYSVKEQNPPKGYALDTACHAFNITVGKTTTLNIADRQTCESEYAALGNKNDPLGRIKIYQKYLAKGQNYTNLLNFSNTTNPCSAAKNCDDTIEVGCLSSKFVNNSSFSANNLSCYDETIKVGTIVGYCGLTFELKNNLNGSYGYTRTFNFGSDIRSGTMIIQRDFANRIVAQGNLLKTCYVYGTGIGNSVTSESHPNTSYSSYVGSLTLNGEALEESQSSDSWRKTVNSSTLSTFTKSFTTTYGLNPIYASNGEGKLIEKSECKNNACKFLGYGFASKLDDKDGKYYIPFSLEFKTSSLKSSVNNVDNACEYTLVREIIDVPDDESKNENVNVEFRIIDSKNPFPGRKGIGRITGKNWCSSDDCSNKNEIVLSEIINSNDSYDKTKEGPIYEIRLTPETIKQIRDYNEESKYYDDYTLTCDENGENCKSAFLQKFNIKRIK